MDQPIFGVKHCLRRVDQLIFQSKVFSLRRVTEYNTIIFASLLQDFGELLEKHGKSLDYEHFRHLIIKNNIDVDPELLEMLHHINRKPGEYHGDREKEEREVRKIKAFADIIKNAYLVSKGRGFDDKDEDIHNGENENLLSIFPILKTAKRNQDPTSTLKTKKALIMPKKNLKMSSTVEKEPPKTVDSGRSNGSLPASASVFTWITGYLIPAIMARWI
jgi:hypothetical protein